MILWYIIQYLQTIWVKKGDIFLCFGWILNVKIPFVIHLQYVLTFSLTFGLMHVIFPLFIQTSTVFVMTHLDTELFYGQKLNIKNIFMRETKLVKRAPRRTKVTSRWSWSWRPLLGPGWQCSNNPSSCLALGMEGYFLLLLQQRKGRRKCRKERGERLLFRNAVVSKNNVFIQARCYKRLFI